MKKIIPTDITTLTNFKKFGEVFTKIWGDDEQHVYVFKRIGSSVSYEVIKAKKVKDPDGNIVFTYPSSEDFGTYGYYIMTAPNTRERIEYKVKQFYPEADLFGLDC